MEHGSLALLQNKKKRSVLQNIKSKRIQNEGDEVVIRDQLDTADSTLDKRQYLKSKKNT